MRYRSISSFALATLLTLAVVPATGATVTTVVATPAARSLPVARATSVPLTWNVTRVNSDGSAGATTVLSVMGTFRAGSPAGPVLGTNARSLSQTRAQATVTLIPLRESVLVPAAVVQRAVDLGVGRVYYVRTFDDGTGSATGAVEFRLSGGAGGSFGVERLAVTFEDGSVVDVVEPGTDLRARARVTFSGSGLLRATWEVAEPGGPSSRPLFRPLLLVRRYVSGRQSLVLHSPSLPTGLSGMYRLRLRIIDPEPAFVLPELKYFVRAADPDEVGAMVASGPRSGASLEPDTLFSWVSVPRARAYRLEIFDPDRGDQPVAGVIVDGERSETALSEVTRSRLEPGRYLWQIQAIDGAGRILAQSEPRALFVPSGAPAAGPR